MRFIDFGLNHPYAPLIHDLLKTATIMVVVELLQFFFLKDPLLDQFFMRLFIYTLLGYFVFYMFVDRFLIGGGKTCCPIPFIEKKPPVKEEKEE